MRTAICILLAGSSGLLAPSLAGQAGAPPSVSEDPVYVRRISFGGRLSVLTLNSMSGGTSEVNIPTPPANFLYTAESQSKRAGGGITMQLALSERIALNLDLLYRKIGYLSSAEIRQGIDNPTTVADERKLTTTLEQTRAKVWELPILGRYYVKDRHDPGPRVFVEAGVAIRKAVGVTTSTETNGACCDLTPTPLARQYSKGGVAGAGFQVYDDFGIKVIPEVRYTRWLSRTFDTRPARSAAHQLEVLIGITF